MIRFGDISIVPEIMHKEINFVVYGAEGYMFRLCPHDDGFEISRLDKALGNYPNRNLIEQTAEFIENYYC